MSLIGSLLINVAADSSGFSKGMKDAQSQLGSFVSSLSSGGLGGGIGAITGPIQDALKMIPGIGTVASTAFGALAASTVKAGEDIVQMNTRAKQFGTTTETMSKLMFAAGGASETFTTGLGHFEKMAGEALAGGEEAQRAFARIGAEGATHLPLNQALGETFDAIRKLPTEYERAAAAQQIFGRGSMEMMPMIMKGSAGLEAAAKRAEEFGLVMSTHAADNLREASRGFSSLGLAAKGFANNLAEDLSPVLRDVGQGLEDIINKIMRTKSEMNQGGGFGGFLSTAISRPGQVISADIFSSMGRTSDFMVNAAAGFMSKRQEDATRAGDSAEKVQQDFDRLAKSIQSEIAGIGFDPLIAKIKELQDRGLAAGNAADAMIAVKSMRSQQFAETIKRENDALRDQIVMFDMTEAAAKNYKMMQDAQRKGITDVRELNENKALREKLDLLQQEKAFYDDLAAAQKRGAEVIAGLANPMEKLQERFKELKDLQEKGALNPFNPEMEKNLIAQGLAGPAMDILNAGTLNYHGVGAATLGSSEAASSIFRNQFDAEQNGDPAQVFARGVQVLQQKQEAQIKVLQKIADLLGDQEVVQM